MTLTPDRLQGDLQPAITITMHRQVLRCIVLKVKTGLICYGIYRSRSIEYLTGTHLNGPIRNINITVGCTKRRTKLREKLRVICPPDQSLFDNWRYAK
ncbi:hypothetical protein ACFW04_000633 [Cataglyphis niger]